MTHAEECGPPGSKLCTPDTKYTEVSNTAKGSVIHLGSFSEDFSEINSELLTLDTLNKIYYHLGEAGVNSPKRHI